MIIIPRTREIRIILGETGDSMLVKVYGNSSLPYAVGTRYGQGN